MQDHPLDLSFASNTGQRNLLPPLPLGNGQLHRVCLMLKAKHTWKTQIKTASTIHSRKTNAYTSTQCNEDYCLCISLLHTLVSEQLHIHLTCSLGLHTCSPPPLFFLSWAGLENNSSPPDKTLSFQTSLHKLILRSCSSLHYCVSFKNLLWTEVCWHAILKHFYKP